MDSLLALILSQTNNQSTTTTTSVASSTTIDTTTTTSPTAAAATTTTTSMNQFFTSATTTSTTTYPVIRVKTNDVDESGMITAVGGDSKKGVNKRSRSSRIVRQDHVDDSDICLLYTSDAADE